MKFIASMLAVLVSLSAASAAVAEPAGRAGLALVSSLDARDELLSVAAGGGAMLEREHDPTRMMLASLAVPGAGQLLQGQKRGYLYLLAEIALWGGFFALDSKGSDKRDEYEAFADDNWDSEAYYAWYEDHCADCEDCGYECRPLAEYGTQEYYEDIGKYDTYWRWWNPDGDEGYIEWDQYSDDDETLRDRYYDIRGDSNTYLRQARYALMAAFLNHVASALDSFLSARSGGPVEEERVGGVGVEFDLTDDGEGIRCALVARY